ncbi:TIGR00725 family protein [Methanofollis fontis]|uniref:TIGR00725 family protein n=1 Tax=Methanofollis fontis TaxID=2052832 RepID=A0A483CR29_9EURY|nr:TIGR00725 family protein [Methanofollis fontis]TAJ43488.1 TIGR00725 family protein [Methanofollis fontis]
MQIAVIGASSCSPEEYEAARTVGYLIAGNRETLVCGGLSGVMEGACRGAKEMDGTTLGIIPGTAGENPYVDVVVRTGMSHARNALVVGSADAVIAIGGGYGTLSEIGLALKMKKAVFGVGTWEIDGIFRCATPEEAVLMAVRASRLSRPSGSPPSPRESH